MKRDEPSNLAIFFAVLAWIGFTALASTKHACLPFCGEFALFIASLIGVGGLAPAWVVLTVATVFFPKKKADDT